MSRKIKIGVILNHVSLRSDIRLFIEELSKSQQVVLFGSKEDATLLKSGTYEVREVKQVGSLVKRVYHKILKLIYYYFGNLPKTRDNYRDYFKRRLYKEGTKIRIFSGLIKLKLQLILPEILSFDKYILLRHPDLIEMDDIDCCSRAAR